MRIPTRGLIVNQRARSLPAIAAVLLGLAVGSFGCSTVPPRTVNPSFTIKQPEQEMDRILADGQPHSISVLFRDEYKIRVKMGQGDVRARYGQGLVALNDRDGAMASINTVIGRYELAGITALFFADTKTEAELEAREKQDEALNGGEFPNDGSWATLTLAKYTAAQAKELALALQKLPAVRMADILSIPKVGV